MHLSSIKDEISELPIDSAYCYKLWPSSKIKIVFSTLMSNCCIIFLSKIQLQGTKIRSASGNFAFCWKYEHVNYSFPSFAKSSISLILQLLSFLPLQLYLHPLLLFNYEHFALSKDPLYQFTSSLIHYISLDPNITVRGLYGEFWSSFNTCDNYRCVREIQNI